MPPVLYLVDASVFIFRAYYSVPLELVDRDGNPVNAVHGFARFLGDLLERESPERIAVAFDESLEQSYRNEIYPAYKANREPAPAELKRQFAICREVTSALGLSQYGPEQVDFLRYRPVLSNEKLVREFGFSPSLTSDECFERYRLLRFGARA